MRQLSSLPSDARVQMDRLIAGDLVWEALSHTYLDHPRFPSTIGTQ
jgi:hypothetical protein